jgi:hypothetical protein
MLVASVTRAPSPAVQVQAGRVPAGRELNLYGVSGTENPASGRDEAARWFLVVECPIRPSRSVRDVHR